MPWQLSKQFSKFIFQYSIQIYSLFGQTEEEGKDFSEGCKEGRGRVEDYTQEHIIVITDKKSLSIFQKFEIILSLCYLLDNLTNKYNRA